MRPALTCPLPQLCGRHNVPLLQLLRTPHLRGLPPGLLRVSPPTGARGAGGLEVLAELWALPAQPTARDWRAPGAPVWLEAEPRPLPALVHLHGMACRASLLQMQDRQGRQCICVRAYTCIHTHVDTYVCIHGHTHMYTGICMHVYKSTHTHNHICIYTCIYIYMYIYIYIHTHTHIYIHMHFPHKRDWLCTLFCTCSFSFKNRLAHSLL